ncbi:cobalamin biosynthesis protein CobQ [Acetobacterium bakii]|uniref:Cobalamin biosynthesis protein CobQ n=1 Tax=Acetobacterium bakii TaxID=52689 RepID=A0A0L6TXP5_9FIRM|nr:cobalamin biosynthesis protein CobQ [Acetobacterium bakii]KNZ41054.1 cobalamin biosynthesis protein CobQ [Acetobacterium bakii]
MANILRIGWLFPNTLNLHGDRGNILAIKAEGLRRGYSVEVHQITLDTLDFDPMNYDFLFCAPGEIVHFKEIVRFLTPHKNALSTFIETRPLLVTGTSIAIFGKLMHRCEDYSFSGLGLLNVDCVENKTVYGDDLYFTCCYNDKEMEIIGCQIQMMNLEILEETPFGLLKYGYGNTGKTTQEGVIKGQGIFTNTLGPVLICNPWLTEEIVNLIEHNKGMHPDAIKRDNTLEENSFKTKLNLIKTKETALTNTALSEQ